MSEEFLSDEFLEDYWKMNFRALVAEREEARQWARRLFDKLDSASDENVHLKAENAALRSEIKQLQFDEKMGDLASMLDNIELNELRDEVEQLKQQRNVALRNWGLSIGPKNLLSTTFLSQEEKNVLLEMQNEY